MDWASFVLFSQRQVSFDRSELIHNPAACMILTPVTNFQTLPDCCKHSTPSLLLSTQMPHPSQREVRFLVLKFQLDRLRRSSSSSPIQFGGFHWHACMQACKFGPAHSPAGSHHSIVQTRLVALFLHSNFNILAQRSHQLHDRIHTAQCGTMQGPNFSNYHWLLCSSINNRRIPLYFAA